MVHADLMEALRAIVSQEPPWNEDDLAEWAEEFLMAYEEVKMAAMMEQERLLQEQRIPPLKRLVRPYQHDPLLPALP